MMHIERLCLIGVGLIGGSWARALRDAGAVGEIIGCGRTEASLQRAVELGVIDRYECDPAQAVLGADMVVLGVPLGGMRGVLAAIRETLAPHAIITDVGSAKGSVVADAEAVFGRVPPRFVPGHPIAGTEKSGVEASFKELFRHRRVILTPVADTDPDAVATVRALWEVAGAEVVAMDVEHHDEVLAATSHLPHVLAYGLVDTLAHWDDNREIFQYAAGGFRDFTRIASSDPRMWRDICLANREALLTAMKRYITDLNSLLESVEQADGERLEAVFDNAKQARDHFISLLEQ
ncbi:prephenate dehydrogenase [Alkalilimnicola ehrlichii]|uniref:prephenate dehydrogenase n=1 Tax=Alkalilimnicola ehrlichii TaxID=351052 RepID=A0A3E0WLB4_9GAMM|nr:prephenate dehydrogenase/arogenate dehydrogenase family protein [Alkalilimnicola ehrlichii]RFA27758.1 prephenate dehydrogenase [Alkalilimnicola ehrlichii]RFA33598.1 prephenate dehydrogenase [Alkalilimnicola ehrlichii]